MKIPKSNEIKPKVNEVPDHRVGTTARMAPIKSVPKTESVTLEIPLDCDECDPDAALPPCESDDEDDLPRENDQRVLPKSTAEQKGTIQQCDDLSPEAMERMVAAMELP